METDLQSSGMLEVLLACLRHDLAITVASERLDTARSECLVVE